jgi:hypothetical protein
VCWHGRLDNITDLVTFEADEFEDLPSYFAEAVDDYIFVCEGIGKERANEKCNLADVINCPFCGSDNIEKSIVTDFNRFCHNCNKYS